MQGEGAKETSAVTCSGLSFVMVAWGEQRGVAVSNSGRLQPKAHS